MPSQGYYFDSLTVLLFLEAVQIEMPPSNIPSSNRRQTLWILPVTLLFETTRTFLSIQDLATIAQLLSLMLAKPLIPWHPEVSLSRIKLIISLSC